MAPSSRKADMFSVNDPTSYLSPPRNTQYDADTHMPQPEVNPSSQSETPNPFSQLPMPESAALSSFPRAAGGDPNDLHDSLIAPPPISGSAPFSGGTEPAFSRGGNDRNDFGMRPTNPSDFLANPPQSSTSSSYLPPPSEFPNTEPPPIPPPSVAASTPSTDASMLAAPAAAAGIPIPNPTHKTHGRRKGQAKAGEEEAAAAAEEGRVGGAGRSEGGGEMETASGGRKKLGGVPQQQQQQHQHHHHRHGDASYSYSDEENKDEYKPEYSSKHVAGTDDEEVSVRHMKEMKNVTEGINDEYHDPYDDWSSRDFFVSAVPTIIAYAFQDVAFRSGLIVATAVSYAVLLMRMTVWDTRQKSYFPLLDIVNVLMYPVLLGTSWRWFSIINRWFNIIVPGAFGASIFASITLRRPFTATYARYPKFDRGGRALWLATPLWRRTSDFAALIWLWSTIVACTLSLIPVMLGHHSGWNVLNIIFNYITPLLSLIVALLATQFLGYRYRERTVNTILNLRNGMSSNMSSFRTREGTSAAPSGPFTLEDHPSQSRADSPMLG